MNTIDHRRFAKSASKRRGAYKKRLFQAIGAMLVLFILANLIVAVAYRNKALPNTSIGMTDVGGKSYSDIETLIKRSMLPQAIAITYKDKKTEVPVRALGVTINQTKTMDAITSKPLVPLWSFVHRQTIPVELDVNESKLNAVLDSSKAVFSLAPRNKHVMFKEAAFTTADASEGYELNTAKTKTEVLRSLARFNTSATAIVNNLPAGNNNKDLSKELAGLQKYLQTPITFTYGGQKITPSKADKGSWFVENGDTMVLSAEKINGYLSDMGKKQGITIANQSDLLLAVQYAMPRQLTANLRVSAAATSKVRTYCVAAKGVSSDGLADLRGKLALTYSDLQGWNADGALAFKHVDAGCSYTVWLTAPALMTSFGAICDDFYNCQVGTNVIVNNDRWLHATEPWLKTGQDIETYRLLIINHETGHRIGFRDNNVCPGAGQPAPVMMQQSIDLKGCVFNVWPLPSELANLKSML